MVQENERILAAVSATKAEPLPTELPVSEELKNKQKFLTEQLPHLTYTERLIYDLYLQGLSTKEVLEEMNIKENTLKYHNKNIYSKLGVSSRKQLLQLAQQSAEDK